MKCRGLVLILLVSAAAAFAQTGWDLRFFLPAASPLPNLFLGFD
jgi:hypothetical protein